MLCPYCKEEIKDGAIKCRHCKSNLQSHSNHEHEQVLRIPYSKLKIGYIYVGVAAAVATIGILFWTFQGIRNAGTALVVAAFISAAIAFWDYVKTILLNFNYSGLIIYDDHITFIQPEPNHRQLTMYYSNIITYSVTESSFTLQLKDATGAEDALSNSLDSIFGKFEFRSGLRELYTPLFNNETHSISFSSLFYFDMPKAQIANILQSTLSKNVNKQVDILAKKQNDISYKINNEQETK